MLLMVHDVLIQVWPEEAYIATGTRVIAGPTIVDPEEGAGRRVSGYGGWAEQLLPGVYAASWVLQSYYAFKAGGVHPVIEVDWTREG